MMIKYSGYAITSKIKLHIPYRKILKAISLLLIFCAFDVVCAIQYIRLFPLNYAVSFRVYHKLVSPSFLETPLTKISNTKLTIVLNRFTAAERIYWLLIIPILYT